MSVADHAAEEAVLGGILLTGRIPPSVHDTGLRAAHFHLTKHQGVYDRMLQLDTAGQNIDTLTVKHCDWLAGAVPNLGSLPNYARTIVDKARLRDYIKAAHKLQEIAESGDETRLSEVDALLSQSRAEDSSVYDRRRLAEVMLERLKAAEIPGWRLPFFDRKVRPRTVWLWGGWTSHGKTVWTDQCAEEFHGQGAKVWMWLNEMTAEERVIRFASAKTGIDVERVEENTLTDAERDAIVTAMDAIPFEIVECNGWYVEEICRDIRLRKPDVAVIDILHRIPYRDERDLAHISQVLGDTAKLAGCVVWATVHLNEKMVTGAARPQPTLGTIKGASALKQDADVVGMVFRDDDPVTGRPTDKAQIYSLKTRMMKAFGKAMWFDGGHARFTEREEWM